MAVSPLDKPPYTPLSPPPVQSVDLQQVENWVKQELDTIARYATAQPGTLFTPGNAVPARPRTGILTYADGTNWNPGAAEGLYIFRGGVWVPILAALVGTAGRYLRDNGANVQPTFSAISPGDLPVGPFVSMLNGKVVASVAGNALTLAIKTFAGADPSVGDPVIFVFRNITAATGDYVVLKMTQAGNPGSQVTIPSGATLGHVSGRNQQIILYVVNFGGTPLLAVGTPLFDLSVRTRSCGVLNSSSTSASTLYCGGGTGAIPYYPVARCVSNQATAGTWAAVPTQIDLAPFTLPSNACDIYLNTPTGTLPNGVFIKVPYDTVLRDDDGVAVLGNNSIQPTVPGTYSVTTVGYAAAYLISGATLTEGNPGLIKNGVFANANGAYSSGQIFGRAVSGAANREAGGAISSLIPMNGTSDYMVGAFATQGTNGFNMIASTDLNHLTCIRVGP